jgi:RNA ligase
MTTTTLLTDLFSTEALRAEIDGGYIRERVHPSGHLAILNYSEATQYERRWNDVTRACRGLIYSTDTLEVVARPWKKFGNWDESGYPYPPVGPMIMAPKFDGSLGILYANELDDELQIATRGSFESDQAKHATRRLDQIMYSIWQENNYEQPLDEFFYNSDFTFLFEIIYPENRIVVDYKGEDRLVLLDVIENSTGLQRIDIFDEIPWPDKSPKILVSEGFSHSIVDKIPPGEEGFVLSWPTRGFMCKMKSAEYVELHRIVTGLSKKTVWEMLGQGKTTDDIKVNIPDELYGWVDQVTSELYDAAQAIIDEAYGDFDYCAAMLEIDLKESFGEESSYSRIPRKNFAAYAQKFPETRAYLFKILDGANSEQLWKMVWKTLKPAGETRVWGRGEDVA